MSDIKVSDKLLSFVLGCECEFKFVRENEISFTHNGLITNIDNVDYIPSRFELLYRINLDTFIMLCISKIEDANLEEMRIKAIEEMEEWVAEKVGGEG